MNGQKSLQRRRLLKEIYFIIKQEPKTKKSLKYEDKQNFRKAIKERLKESKRRAYRGDLILEIDYYTTKGNPPPLQTLTKNYLDLLHKPMPEIDDLEGILFKDDSQIKILIANYHLNEHGDNEAQIRIKTSTLKSFYEDISLAYRIIRNDFIDKDYSNNYKFVEYLKDEGVDDNAKAYSDYNNLLKNQLEIKNTFGEEYFLTRELLYKKEIQEHYLSFNRMNIYDLVHLFQSEFSGNRECKNDMFYVELWKSTKNYVFLASDFFDLGKQPSEDGDSKILKAQVRIKLNEFKKENSVLFPFLVPLSIMVLFVPPKKNIIDLDNLARNYIVPFIIEILRPPSSHVKTVNNFSFFEQNLEIHQKFNANSLTNYQLIQLPRQDNSPENGEIKFVLTNGNSRYKNVRKTVNDIIRKWV
ncbi:hypothetical protein [Fulvivirga sediminis]|uniref:Uncharacterized protein n=1 Tax=Fulvivirga sediminis TaxID=2803949 RepID=A0A937F6P5_9BACT|nr:hypothetical protein [Fulvivirga sediminis]MBL3657437.1 hypothetical protein [Fulvivirga sediminis]